MHLYAQSTALLAAAYAEGKAPPSRDMPTLTWAQSTQQLLQVILENDWYTTYQPADARGTTGAE